MKKAVFAGVLVALAAFVSARAQAPPPAAAVVEPLRFHHVHLNSVNPATAADYYPKPFALSATRTTYNGYEGEGVTFLEEIHPWGTSRAAMIEGPDRIAIELVEVR